MGVLCILSTEAVFVVTKKNKIIACQTFEKPVQSEILLYLLYWGQTATPLSRGVGSWTIRIINNF